MRKLFLPALLLASLFLACENKNPAGPAGVGPGGVVVTQTTSSTSTTSTTTTIPATTTTSTTSTTTTVVGSLARRYVAFQAPPNVPADMTLFFQLLTTGLSLSSIVERLPFLGDGPSVVENEYKVTGVYRLGNNLTGTVEGELGEALNPLETGGMFEGRLLLNAGQCTAERLFEGPLAPQTLDWDGGRTLRDCPGSPLSFGGFTMVRSDAPLPTTTSTPPTSTTSTSTTTTPTTSTSSTTSTTTTTTAVVCSYSLSPTSARVPAAGATDQVVVATLPTCPWTAQSFATSWLTLTPPSGTGPGTVTYTAAANTNGPQRTGTLVIGGQTFTVTQDAPPPPDLVAVVIAGTTGSNCGAGVASIPVRNIGTGAATVASQARFDFTAATGTPAIAPVVRSVGTLAAGAEVTLTEKLPPNCFGNDSSFCPFTVTVDATNTVYELPNGETNNTSNYSCFNGSVPAIQRGSDSSAATSPTVQPARGENRVSPQR